MMLKKAQVPPEEDPEPSVVTLPLVLVTWSVDAAGTVMITVVFAKVGSDGACPKARLEPDGGVVPLTIRVKRAGGLPLTKEYPKQTR